MLYVSQQTWKRKEMLRPKILDRLINIYILRLREVVRVTIKQKKCDYDRLLFVKVIMIKKI